MAATVFVFAAVGVLRGAARHQHLGERRGVSPPWTTPANTPKDVTGQSRRADAAPLAPALALRFSANDWPGRLVWRARVAQSVESLPNRAKVGEFTAPTLRATRVFRIG